jgi:hypothetical protein
MIICDKHGEKLRGDDCPYCRIQELEAERVTWSRRWREAENKVQELETVREKAQAVMDSIPIVHRMGAVWDLEQAILDLVEKK